MGEPESGGAPGPGGSFGQQQLSVTSAEEPFIRGLFSNYYARAPADALAPKGIGAREFGFGSWTRKIESRHFRFSQPTELKSYLVRNTPFFVSCSSAYYEFPDRRPMPKKNWLGADLVFDLDADHLKLECLEKGEHAKGWVCQNCLDQVKAETVKLIEDFLLPDFGFSRDEVCVNFSGNRGYHVHVESEDVKGMSGWARREVADYIAGASLDPSSFFSAVNVGLRSQMKMVGPKPSDSGWGGRIARRFIELLETGRLARVGVDPANVRKLERNRERVVEGVSRGNWDQVNIPEKQKTALVSRVVESASVNVEGMGEAGGEVDAGVTFDVSKLLRLPESLHGETGLSAKRIAGISALAGFEPMRDAVVFGDSPVRVKCGSVPKFSISGAEYGPFSGDELELPEAAAVYLICKRKASLWKSA
jgi:DNA primase small subunit